jgi:hypothetical protein
MLPKELFQYPRPEKRRLKKSVCTERYTLALLLLKVIPEN